MACHELKNSVGQTTGFISISSIEYSCPYCGRGYNDEEEVVFNRAVNNKKGYATQNCKSCKQSFGIASEYKGLVAFSLRKE